MRRTFAILLGLVLVLSLFLSGCSTIRAWVEDVPVWVIQKPGNTLTKVFFTASGTDLSGNEMTAQQAAYEQLLDEISEFLGYDVEAEYRRELLQTGRIEDLQLELTDRFLQEDGSSLTLSVLAEANRKVISKLVRDNLTTKKDEEDKINEPESEAKNYYRQQDDFDAFSLYIEAAVEAYISPLAEAESRYAEIMGEAVSVLQGMNLQQLESDTSGGVFAARVTRGSGVFAPKISSVPVKAVFPVKNAAGKTREESLVVASDSKGLVTVMPSNTNFRGTGILTMFIDISEPLAYLIDTVGEQDPYVRQLRIIAVEKSLEYEFAITSEIAGSVITAAILDYSKNGTLLKSSESLDAMVEMLEKDGLYVNRIYPGESLNDESSILAFARKSYADTRTIAVIGSSGISGIANSQDRYIASVKGSARIYTLSDGVLVDEIGEFAANGFGADEDLARSAAFTRFGQIAASLVIGRLL